MERKYRMQLGEMMLTKQKFTKIIEDTVNKKKLSYIDSIIYICEENNIEVEDAKKYVSSVIKEKLEAEARRLNFLPKGNELPFG